MFLSMSLSAYLKHLGIVAGASFVAGATAYALWKTLKDQKGGPEMFVKLAESGAIKVPAGDLKLIKAKNKLQQKQVSVVG